MSDSKQIKTGHIADLPADVFKRHGRKPKYENINSLDVDGFIEVHDHNTWLKMRGAAHSHAQRENKKFKAKWCDWRQERAQDREDRGLSTAGMDTAARGFIWRVK